MDFEEQATCWRCGRAYLRVAVEKWRCLDMMPDGAASRLEEDDSLGDICPYCHYNHGGGGVWAFLNLRLPQEHGETVQEKDNGSVQ